MIAWKISSITKVIFTRSLPKIPEAWTFAHHRIHKQEFWGTAGTEPRTYLSVGTLSPWPTCAVRHSSGSEDATRGPKPLWLMSPRQVRFEEGAWDRGCWTAETGWGTTLPTLSVGTSFTFRGSIEAQERLFQGVWDNVNGNTKQVCMAICLWLETRKPHL